MRSEKPTILRIITPDNVPFAAGAPDKVDLFYFREKAPSNPADWAIKDVPQAKAILAEIKGRS